MSPIPSIAPCCSLLCLASCGSLIWQVLSLESEASKLQELQELLYATAAAAERQAFMASPRSLPVHFSLPATRELGVNKCRIAALQLQQGALRAIVDAVRQLEPTPPRVSPPTPLACPADASPGFARLSPMATRRCPYHATHPTLPF